MEKMCKICKVAFILKGWEIPDKDSVFEEKIKSLEDWEMLNQALNYSVTEPGKLVSKVEGTQLGLCQQYTVFTQHWPHELNDSGGSKLLGYESHLKDYWVNRPDCPAIAFKRSNPVNSEQESLFPCTLPFLVILPPYEVGFIILFKKHSTSGPTAATATNIYSFVLIIQIHRNLLPPRYTCPTKDGAKKATPQPTASTKADES